MRILFLSQVCRLAEQSEIIQTEHAPGALLAAQRRLIPQFNVPTFYFSFVVSFLLVLYCLLMLCTKQK